MYKECLITTPGEMEIIFHEADLRAKPTNYQTLLAKTKDSWSFLNEIALGMVLDGELKQEEVGITLELYSYDFMTSKYSLEGSIPVYGIIDNNSEFNILLEDNPSSGNLFLNRLARLELSLSFKTEVYNRLKFSQEPYSQNGSDVLIYNRKQIFLGEMKLWRK